MTALAQQQKANNLQAVEQERKNILELELALKNTQDKFQRLVIRERIKICKKFMLRHMQTAQRL